VRGSLGGARALLDAVGYGDEAVAVDYPVWLGPARGVALAEMVAFGRPAPMDMSTAVVSVSSQSVDAAYEIAQVIAAPYCLVANNGSVDVWVAEPTGPRSWRTDVTSEDSSTLSEWLRPLAALTVKVGLRQPPLFDVPVNLLASASSRSADQLAPIVGHALETAAASLAPSRSSDPARAKRLLHRRAARLVVGGLTALVIRDRDGQASPDTDDLLRRVAGQHPSTFSWLAKATSREWAVLVDLVDQLGDGIDYRSLDPSILSHVYEQALVDDDDRKKLGIHYTPPGLARRLVTDLPVELVPPGDRHVLDPSCGSGTLLIAAHDRLRGLQPSGWPEAERHSDLSVHLHGYDIDPFASEIARLSLLLHAQPAGNGWQIDALNTLRQPVPDPQPSLIITNPPWRFSAHGHRTQSADDFLRWSMRALAPGGLLGVVLPASWLSADNSADTRDELVAHFDVFEVWRLPEGTFATSRQAPAVLLARRRDGFGGKGARVVRDVDRRSLNEFLDGYSAAVTHVRADNDAPLQSGPPAPDVRVPTVELGEIADVLSGPQPLPTIADRGHGVLYLNHFGDVPSYGLVDEELLWRVRFPADFQTARGAKNIEKRKVLASAARSANSPWRFQIAIDMVGIAVRNSVRGIAPHDQDDEDILYALAVIVGSGLASAFSASFGGDRNIPAAVLRSLPIPWGRSALRRLARLGRQAAELADDPRALNKHLRSAEAEVWDIYEVDDADRSIAVARLAGHPAPEGFARYNQLPASSPCPETTFRRVGAVLDVEGNAVRLWVNGVTPDEGVLVPVPPCMPGWLVRGGATFDVTGVETIRDLSVGRFRFQPMAWQDIDLDSDTPTPIFPR